jgi:hypothetical protein
MRLLTGVLFRLGIAWFGLPYFDAIFSYEARLLATRMIPSK